MVPLAAPATPFEAKVLAARLGADGILCQVRGGIDGMYPVGRVEVLVAEDDLDAARELLLIDEVESAFDSHEPARHGASAWWLLLVAVPALAIFAALRLFVA